MTEPLTVVAHEGWCDRLAVDLASLGFPVEAVTDDSDTSIHTADRPRLGFRVYAQEDLGADRHEVAAKLVLLFS